MKPIAKSSDLEKLKECFDGIGVPYREQKTPDRAIWIALKNDRIPDEPIDEVKDIVIEFSQEGKFVPHEQGVQG